MRIIHCADLHLDSRMTAHLSAEKARERRQELLETFRRMVEFAAEHEVEAIIIAGDLFDRKKCSVNTKNRVAALIREHPELLFFYLQGNHDDGGMLEGLEKKLPNLRLFSSERWISWQLGQSDVFITGGELTPDNYSRMFRELKLDQRNYNLLVLHGQAEDSLQSTARTFEGSAPILPLRTLSGRGIDYLALGHVHKRATGRLDGRGIWCYSGCPEGRGFDECGQQGCILLDIDTETHRTEMAFVPLGGRKLFEIPVDITSCQDSHMMLRRIQEKLDSSPCSSRDLVKLLLEGETELQDTVPLEYLTKQLEPLFYFVAMEDRTRLRIDYGSFAADPSLKGEFVRRVLQDADISGEDRKEIIQLGIRLLMGVKEYED